MDFIVEWSTIPWADLIIAGGFLYLIRKLIDKVDAIGTRITVIETERQVTKDTGICQAVVQHEITHHPHKSKE